jgi:hypothetical protein
MLKSDSVSGVRSLSSVEEHARRKPSTSETVSVASAVVIVCSGLLASAVWSLIGPTPIAVFSALVQTGVPTRLVLLGLLFGCGFGLFALRTVKPVWYGHVLCVVAVAMGWDMLRRLAITIQPAEVLGLFASGYLLVRGFVDIQEGYERAT